MKSRVVSMRKKRSLSTIFGKYCREREGAPRLLHARTG